MFGFIKKIFIGLLTSLVNASNHTKCVSSSNQKWNIQSIYINLQPNEYAQVLHHYPFAVNLESVSECVIFLMTRLIKYVF